MLYFLAFLVPLEIYLIFKVGYYFGYLAGIDKAQEIDEEVDREFDDLDDLDSEFPSDIV